MAYTTRLTTIGAAVVLTGATVLAGACGDGDVPSVPSQAVQVPAQDVDTLLSEVTSGITDRHRLVLRSESEWTTFWQNVYATVSPTPDPPRIDFGESTVVAVSMGRRPTGGHRIEIEEMHRTDGELYVVVHGISPGDSCITTQVLTQPVAAVRVPSTDLDVRFVERESEQECS